MTFIALLAILAFYLSGISSENAHLEWLSGIQGLASFATLLFFGQWLKTKAKMRVKTKKAASPLIASFDYPSPWLPAIILLLVSIASFAPPILFDAGFIVDLRKEISAHLLLIAIFFDLFFFTFCLKKKDSPVGEELHLVSYKKNIDGAIEAALKGIDSDGITLAGRSLSLIPTAFSDLVNELEYRSLYLFDNLEVVGLRAVDRSLFPYVQEVLGRILRLSGNLLTQIVSLSTAGVEVAGRVVRALIQKGHLEAGEKGLFTFVQAVNSLKNLPTGLGDFLIRIVQELEKGLEALYKADKTRPIKPLLVPLAELRRVLQQERFATHPETILGQRELDRVIDLFKTLETVLLTTPQPGQKKAAAEPETPGAPLQSDVES